MLSIGRLGGGQERYYTDAVAKGEEDYYMGHGEARGKWLGRAAGTLGLDGSVDEQEFGAVLRGQEPSGGSLRSPLARTKVAGYDLTFSAPKSVSVLYGVGDDAISAAARDAHDEAVRQALGYLERHAAKVRRGRAGRRLLAADGITVAAFRHRTSRAGDPQLHTHAIVANLAQAEGRWSALDSRSLYAHARTAGFLYQAALRDRLTRRLHVEWEPVHNGAAEVRGIDPAVLRHFSRRRLEIEEHLHQLGRRSSHAAEIAALDTRRSKEYDVPMDRLRADWRARAAEHGFGRDELAGVLHRSTEDRMGDAQLALAAERLGGPGGVTRNASTFDRRDVLRDWAAAHRAGAPVATLENLTDAWLATDSVVPLAISQRTGSTAAARYTTASMLEIEQQLIDACRRRRGADVARADASAVEAAIAARPSLAREQAIVVRGLTRSGDGVQVVRAAAGTGKTFALDAAREAWQASGHSVLGCALSARAAVELESQAGIPSSTVARLQQDLSHGYGLPERAVLVVDEAGMVGSRQLAELAARSEQANAKLVLVGDDRQLPEIDAGGAFRGIADRIGALELRTVRRQREQWDREALTDLRHGRVEAWAKSYRDHGRLLSYGTAAQAREALTRDWWHAAREPSTDAVMIAHRRSDVADLNAQARKHMDADGRLGSDRLDAAGREFAPGDRVLARRNDRRLGVINGQRGVVSGVDIDARVVSVAFDGGATARLDADYLDAGHLDHGYALTAHAAQGATVDKAFVLGSDDVCREWGYTAMSRHRDEARYYVVSDGRPEPSLPGLEPCPDPLLTDVVDALGPSRRKQLALDAGEPKPEQGGPDSFGELRTAARAGRRLEGDAARAFSSLQDAQLRLATLEAELEATPRLRRRARAELRNAIERQRGVLAHWQAAGAQLDAELSSIDARSAAAKFSLEPPPPTTDAPDLDAVPAVPELDSGPDLGP